MANDNKVSALIGTISGMVKFLFLDTVMLGRFLEAIVTAFFCGAMGILGKFLMESVKKKLLAKKVRKGNQNFHNQKIKRDE